MLAHANVSALLERSDLGKGGRSKTGKPTLRAGIFGVHQFRVRYCFRLGFRLLKRAPRALATLRLDFLRLDFRRALLFRAARKPQA